MIYEWKVEMMLLTTNGNVTDAICNMRARYFPLMNIEKFPVNAFNGDVKSAGRFFPYQTSDFTCEDILLGCNEAMNSPERKAE
jgi:hypothetical protein